MPKALGYAGIANVPIENGLYAAAAGTILYALFGTSRQISTGPSSALAAVAGSVVITAGVVGGDDATVLVAGVALVAGVLFLLMAVFKLGWISQFLSKAVITGFLFGAAIDVTVGELPKLTGTEADGDSVWREFVVLDRGARRRPQRHDAARRSDLAGGALRAAGRRPRRSPGRSSSWSAGSSPRSCSISATTASRSSATCRAACRCRASPTSSLLWDNAATVGIAAVGIVLIGFSQTAGDARHFATKHRYRVDIDQETVAQGMANVGAGLIQGIPVSTSLSASSANDTAGARSPIASLATGWRRRPHAARPGPAVLRPAEGRARRRDHPGGDARA